MKKVLAVLVVFIALSGSLKLATSTIVVVTNSIDYSYELIEFLEQYFNVICINAEEFPFYRHHTYFVVLGGPDAPDGIGEMVQNILTAEEMDYLRTSGGYNFYMHTELGKVYFFLAGFDRDQTRAAIANLRTNILQYMPKEPIKWPEDQYIHSVTDMVITDLDNDSVYDYVYGVWKVVSDPWNRGALYVYEDGRLKWYYHLSTVIKSLTCYDVDGDGAKEIIAACDILEGESDLYVFDRYGTLKWRRKLPGTPQLLYCYETFVGVYLYGQGDRILIFDYSGRRVKDLPVSGVISKFEISDIDYDDDYELIVSGVLNSDWEHFFAVCDLLGNVLWNYQTREHINDFQFYDIDNDGIQETLLGVYDSLHITRGGEVLGKVELPPPVLQVRILNDQVLIVTRRLMFLIELSDLVALQGETVSVHNLASVVSSVIRVEENPTFLFLEDIDFDDTTEILAGDGEILDIYELSDFVPVTEEIPTAPLEEAEAVPEEERVVYLVSVCEVQFTIPEEETGNLNQEWVKICNDGDIDIDMSGWVLMNDVGRFYEFPEGFILAAGASVTVYTGEGEDSETELYWGDTAEVWNDEGDVVTLEDSEGAMVEEHEWLPEEEGEGES
ncbi:MAG: hypothetical protein AYK18_04150 [Theionarchaea archaeon DG-70]|nr:MAG: hypothetical protein AYK18_04150 [Theionarchaea archaeon DG-70]